MGVSVFLFGDGLPNEFVRPGDVSESDLQLAVLTRSLTAYSTSSSQKTLGVMLTDALIGVPMVLAHTVNICRIFRGKVKLDKMGY